MIVQAVRWYFRFTLSIRDVDELMAERGIEVSREAIRCWVIKFGPLVAANPRRANGLEQPCPRPAIGRLHFWPSHLGWGQPRKVRKRWKP